jgi:hypothetical protein
MYKVFMKKIIVVKRIVLLTILEISIIVVITVSCKGLQHTGKDKILAKIELDILIFQIKNKQPQSKLCGIFYSVI